MKKVFWVCGGIFILFAIASGWVFWYLQFQKDSLAINGFRSQINTMQVLVDNTTSEHTICENSLAKTEKELAPLQEKIKYTETERDSLIAALADAKNTLIKTNTELEKLDRLHKCKINSGYKFDFASNQSISNSLKEYVGDIGGRVVDADWDMVWNNSKTAYHEITADYLFPYIVSFKDQKLGQIDAIFDITGWCLITGEE